MNGFYFVIARDVLHPETYDTLLHKGEILNNENIEWLCITYGFDQLPCEVCKGIKAAYVTQAQMLD